MRRNLDLFCILTMTRKNLTQTKRVHLGDQKLAGFVTLSVLFNHHSGATYMRSKSYLVVEISTNIVTEHCCRVCVLKMLDGDRKIQMIYRCILLQTRTHIMMINQHNSVLHVFSVPNWSEYAESSTYWQFIYYRPPPDQFRYTVG